MDKYRLDSHKLIYHVDRTSDWLAGENIYPLYAEISPCGACNHRCTYCGLDFMQYQSRRLETGMLKERLVELGRLGLKSVMYAGEGEPFLHKDMAEIIEYTKRSGIDVGVTSNAVFCDEKTAERTIPHMSWIKVSINGATRETYSKIHQCKPDDLDRVMKNMTYAAQVKKKHGYQCTLGMQLLLLPENHHEAKMLAQKARDIGMDYLVIKPYSQHPLSKTEIYKNIRYSDYDYLEDELKGLGDENFNVIFRVRTMKKWDEAARNYKRCLALPFWTYIDAGGDVWGCSIYLGNKDFLYGNIYKNTFQQIWEGEARKKSLERVASCLNVENCRVNCRMDEINRYLWELKNPPAHVNFI
jgi:MoaA/NifB/PqqE/SkfB family radical SAM enzyme